MTVLALAAIVLSGCNSAPKEAAPKPTATSTPKPVAVAFDPSFVSLAGQWRSQTGSAGEKQLLQIDIASGGGYSIDVRIPGSPTEQVVETGRGKLTHAGDSLTAAPEAGQKGRFLLGIGAWKGAVSGKSMKLTGVDGKTVDLSWVKL